MGEESQIVCAGHIVTRGNWMYGPVPCLAAGLLVELMDQARDVMACMLRERDARDAIHFGKAATNQRCVFFPAHDRGHRNSMIAQRLHHAGLLNNASPSKGVAAGSFDPHYKCPLTHDAGSAAIQINKERH